MNMASTSLSKGQKEMQQLFSHFDTNGDGKISLSELQLLMKAIGEELSFEEAKAFLHYADSDGDDLLDFKDFVRLADIVEISEKEKSHDEEYMVKEAFKLYEMEGRGFITDMSLKRMLSSLGSSRPIEQCRSMIYCFDLNGDGVLCFEEFKAMMML